MPLIKLDTLQILILIVIISPLVELAAVLIGRKVPLSKLTTSKWLFKLRNWEDNGNIYRRVFKVHKWKKYLPDGAKCFKDDFEKNTLESNTAKYLQLFVAETCRAELVHWMMLLPFFFYYIILSAPLATILLAVVASVNAPCIVAQRYNRPRLESVMKKKLALESIEEEIEILQDELPNEA